MKKFYKIILSGGGTGGHIYPAIAIADGIKNKLKNVEIIFIGAKNRIEMKKVPQAGYPIIGLWISSLNKKNIIKLFFFPFKVIYSLWKAYFILKKIQPDLIIGTGGYASGILLYMAVKKNIPIIIQEQNAVPGFTNKKLSYYAKIIFTAYEETKNYFFSKKIQCLGNPIRKEIIYCKYNRKEACKKFFLNPKKPIILSLGGSQGSHTINKTWLKGLKKIITNNVQLLWQIGEKDFKKFKKYPETKHKYIHITNFINDMSAAYKAADLIVSRAGALTISELCLIGKPCLLIPYPWSVDNHQYKNSQSLLNKEAALVISNEEIDKILIDKVLEIIKNDKIKNLLSKNLSTLGKPKATEEIVKEIIKFLL